MMEVHLSCSLWLVKPRSIPKASNASEMPMKKEGMSLCDPTISLIYHRHQRQTITRNSYFFVCSKKGRKEGVVPFKFWPNMKPLEWGWALNWIPKKPDSVQPLLRPRTPSMSSPSSETCRWVSTSPDDPPDAGNLMLSNTSDTSGFSGCIPHTTFLIGDWKALNFNIFPDLLFSFLALEPKSNSPHLPKTNTNMDLGTGSLSKKIQYSRMNVQVP